MHLSNKCPFHFHGIYGFMINEFNGLFRNQPLSPKTAVFGGLVFAFPVRESHPTAPHPLAPSPKERGKSVVSTMK